MSGMSRQDEGKHRRHTAVTPWLGIGKRIGVDVVRGPCSHDTETDSEDQLPYLYLAYPKARHPGATRISVSPIHTLVVSSASLPKTPLDSKEASTVRW